MCSANIATGGEDVLLSHIAAHVGARWSGPDVTIRGIAYDSRRVQAGDLFCALVGQKTDGHRYLEDALNRGCTALMVEHGATVPAGTSTLWVEDSRRAMALAAAYFNGDPTCQLRLFGVTGTNGKTTTTFMLHKVLQMAGFRTGLIGTVAVMLGDDQEPVTLTTPEAPDLQKLFARMHRAQCDCAVMEVSSFGLVLERVRGARFDAGIFTNLSQDHLELHETMENYLQAKGRLFTQLAESGKDSFAVLNADDPASLRLADLCEVPVVRYGMKQDAEVYARDLDAGPTGNTFVLHTPMGRRKVHQPMAAHFNVYNALATAAAAWQGGLDLACIVAGLEATRGVPGRFELVHAGQPFTVAVDYAHTPDALENVLRSARQLVPGRLLVVFGCGGDRDPIKRPLMGQVAARGADVVVITSDNPRTEEPIRIMEQIRAGLEGSQGVCHLEEDRRAAIALALDMAAPGDCVIIAGKGHETYQVFGDKTIDFDDRKVARELLVGERQS